MISDLEQRVLDLVQNHPAVRSVKLVGSRAQGRATKRSDWDFCLETDQFEKLARALPELLAPLGAEQAPASIADAIDVYRAVRAQAEARFAVRVSRRLEDEVKTFMA